MEHTWVIHTSVWRKSCFVSNLPRNVAKTPYTSFCTFNKIYICCKITERDLTQGVPKVCSVISLFPWNLDGTLISDQKKKKNIPKLPVFPGIFKQNMPAKSDRAAPFFSLSILVDNDTLPCVLYTPVINWMLWEILLYNDWMYLRMHSEWGTLYG